MILRNAEESVPDPNDLADIRARFESVVGLSAPGTGEGHSGEGRDRADSTASDSDGQFVTVNGQGGARSAPSAMRDG
ncbi:MAG TPA: hypothetical protein VLX59_14110, partial [Acidimicrobiales bacterium]|nr:hypothetical protein [Acidimicrobiales bacterium]